MGPGIAALSGIYEPPGTTTEIAADMNNRENGV
jgi:hypothetical protein